MPPDPATSFVTLATAQRLLGTAAAPSSWGVTPERFRFALDRSASQRFADSARSPSVSAVDSYLDSLKAHDLALACACSDGNSEAWDYFVKQYRPELYRSARAIAGDSAGRELADSLYAELYGLRESSGTRKSPLAYFLGRSKLSTWLHAILSQRNVDRLRAGQRTESLEDAPGEKHSEIASADPNVDPERDRYLSLLQPVIAASLAALEARDRLRLAYYYVDERTLAEVGKLFGEHEATASRKLEKTRRKLKDEIDRRLRTEKKLSDAQVRLCYSYAQEKWPFDLTGALSAGK
jgi:RNA polymerase sigma-70 factor